VNLRKDHYRFFLSPLCPAKVRGKEKKKSSVLGRDKQNGTSPPSRLLLLLPTNPRTAGGCCLLGVWNGCGAAGESSAAIVDSHGGVAARENEHAHTQFEPGVLYPSKRQQTEGRLWGGNGDPRLPSAGRSPSPTAILARTQNFTLSSGYLASVDSTHARTHV